MQKIINTTVVCQDIQKHVTKMWQTLIKRTQQTVTAYQCLDVININCISELERTVSVLFIERVCLVDFRIVG